MVFGKHKAGATCIPCLYAEQMVDHGQTLEQVKAVPHLMQMFDDLLAKTGWTWEHVESSYHAIIRYRAGQNESQPSLFRGTV